MRLKEVLIGIAIGVGLPLQVGIGVLLAMSYPHLLLQWELWWHRLIVLVLGGSTGTVIITGVCLSCRYLSPSVNVWWLTRGGTVASRCAYNEQRRYLRHRSHHHNWRALQRYQARCFENRAMARLMTLTSGACWLQVGFALYGVWYGTGQVVTSLLWVALLLVAVVSVADALYYWRLIKAHRLSIVRTSR